MSDAKMICYLSKIPVMKYLFAMSCLCLSLAGSSQLSLRIYHPDGSLYTGSGVLHVEGVGCDMNYSSAFDEGESPFIFINPLLCDSVAFSLTAEADAKTGVSVLDMVRLSKHLLGLDEFTTQLQVIAADANKSQSLSALDLVEIRKLLTGAFATWPSNETLKFYHKNTPNVPAIGTILSRSVTLHIQQGGPIEFWVVKTGDIR